MRIGALKPSHVAVFLEKRRKAGRGATAANREFAVLSSVHNFGMRQGWLEANPCIGVRRNPEKPRKRYVTNAEFLEAFDKSPEPFQDLISFAYLTGIRQTDVMNLKRTEHLKPEGIVWVESKTGKLHKQEWSDAVRFFVRRSMERFPDAEYVFTNRFGQQWGVWAINSQMVRLGVSWSFKDLRAKSQSDAEHSVLGHDAAMERLYRKVIKTRPVR
jgi:integrase